MVDEKKIKFPTTGTYDFPNLILGGKGKYVDKTDLLVQNVQRRGRDPEGQERRVRVRVQVREDPAGGARPGARHRRPDRGALTSMPNFL